MRTSEKRARYIVPRHGTARRPTLRSAAGAVHGDAAEELRIKIRGLLRENFACGGDFHDLINSAGIQEKRDLRAAGVYRIESSGGITLVSEMGFGRDGLPSNP